jgi:hypothetical protein
MESDREKSISSHLRALSKNLRSRCAKSELYKGLHRSKAEATEGLLIVRFELGRVPG